MGRFDGYLICSDFDGTLYIDGKLNDRDTDAIKYFQSEGGCFTYASGRECATFLRAPANANAVNAPIIGFNGAHIIAPDGETVIYRGGLSREQAREVLELLDGINGMNRIEINGFENYAYHPYDATDSEATRREFLDSCAEPYAKMLIRAFPETADAVYAEVKRRLGGKFNITRSWSIGIEINALPDSKGRAARRVKELLGAHTLICVGDYDNDIDMIKAADIGYAVGNATEALKAAADRVTVTCRECAMAAIIEGLEKE